MYFLYLCCIGWRAPWPPCGWAPTWAWWLPPDPGKSWRWDRPQAWPYPGWRRPWWPDGSSDSGGLTASKVDPVTSPAFPHPRVVVCPRLLYPGYLFFTPKTLLFVVFIWGVFLETLPYNYTVRIEVMILPIFSRWISIAPILSHNRLF